MKPKINRKQFIAIFNLLNNLKEINDKGIAIVSDIVTMVNYNFPNSVFLRYQKDYYSGGDALYEFKIAEIDMFGEIRFVDGNFKNIFDRYSFLGECKTFDIENPNDYEKID